MAFIGSDRLLVEIGNPDVGKAPSLVLLDMSVSADFPAAPGEVRFVCDPRYCGMRVRVMAEEAGYGDFSEVMGRDVPFYPAPSQRVIGLLFYLRMDASNKVQGVCVVRSETLLRLASEVGEGVVEWAIWGKFTIAPDTDEVPGADLYTKYLVSGSRFVRVDIEEKEGWVKVRVYDLRHWSRQYPVVGREGGGEEGGSKVRCLLIEAVWELPESMWNVCHAAMLQDSVVFFSVRPFRFLLLLWVVFFDGCLILV